MELNKDKDFGTFLVKIANIIGLSTVAIILLLGLVMFLEVQGPDFRLPQLTSSETVAPAGTAQVTAPAPVAAPADDMWQAPDLASLPATPEGDQIRYGRELVAHTAKYLGPEGSVMHISNGMNCQNCHLDAGTKPYGNNYSLVASSYPKVRARSGMEEDVVKRVSDCFERSLNGEAPKPDSKEMQAMVAYIKWVGQDVQKDDKPNGAGLIEIEYLDRAASPELGKAIYAQKCQVCHGENG
ncbi:MAG: cytochrome C, partial [Hymenobacteraceae bacterium]|nr:cytochrome C [Hymenobacteraceae bacterium]